MGLTIFWCIFVRDPCVKIGKAKPRDVPEIKKLIDAYSVDGRTVPRSLSHLYTNVREFFVCREAGKVIGCGALHVSWDDLAEIRSVAVHASRKGNGIGTALVKACLREARQLGVPQVFALTAAPGFFEKLGFRRIPKSSLPMKVFGECLNCIKYPECSEEAVIRKVRRT